VRGLDLLEHARFVAPLIVPTGAAAAARIAAGTAAAAIRRRRTPGAAVTAHSNANVRNVRRVPTSGISSSAAPRVPTSDPAVETE
jgi:hypothetical protein